MVTRAKELGHEYVALTDHGECNQHLALAKECAAQGLSPIFGMEGYWQYADVLAQARAEKKRPPPSHICLLAATDKGLSNLWALSSEAYTEPYHWYKPTATPELLRTYSEGIYASDGCMLTGLAQAVDLGDEDRARQWLGTLLHIYGDRFYVELHTWQFVNDEVPEQLALNARMRRLNHAKVRLATELGIPMVVVNDSHHAHPDQWWDREMVWAFNTREDSDKLARALTAQKADHLMGEEEISYWMARHGIIRSVVDEAIKNSYDIANKCQVQIKPTLSIPRMGADEIDDLRALMRFCEEGFNRYVLGKGLEENLYYARLESELRLITAKHFAGYFLMVRDYVHAYRSGSWSQFVRNNPRSPKTPLLVGPARGSVGGSLVAYLIGIDIIDPLKYGTLFSRFLSPSRHGLPDIDVDVPQSERPDALSYLPARYGTDNVCAIGTLSHNGPKATLRDLGRALKTPSEDIEAMSKHIEEVERLRDPNDPDAGELTYTELIERKGHVLAPYAAKHPKLFEALGRMVDRVRHSGVHAAGVLVSSEPLLGRVPMRTRNPEGQGKKKVTTTQFDMWEIEQLGGVKLDLLGIRHLDTLSHARRVIYERHGVWIDYDRTGLSVPAGCHHVFTFEDENFADPAIWDQIDRGQTLGVFQVETSNCTEAAIHFKPRSEVDVADLTSIIRPGVADAGLKDVYLRRRAGLEPVVYDHPLMEQIVGPAWVTNTYGVLVYQEQLMMAAQALASFTDDEADALRGAVAKKHMEQLVALKAKFLAGCMSSQAYMCHFDGQPTDEPTKVAEKIWHSIEASGRYAFNWSHAVGYAMISTWEIWTKFHYPAEFLVALLATDTKNTNRYIREARRRKITILSPDINKSQRKFTIEDSNIRYGLDTVLGVGPAACRGIMAGRPYADLPDYVARAGDGADKTVVYRLILIGAFDEMGTREQMLHQLMRERAKEGLASSTLSDPEKLEARLGIRLATDKYSMGIPAFADPKVMYQIEKWLVGTYVTVDPLERYLDTLERCAVRDPWDMVSFAKGQLFVVGGQITSVVPTVTKKGRTPGAAMAHLTISYNEEDFKVVAFPEAWARAKLLLKEGTVVACKVKKLDNGCCLEEVIQLEALFNREGIT